MSQRPVHRSPQFDNLEGRALLSGVPSAAAADAFVVNLYQAVLNRSASPGEVGYWTNRIEHGVSEARVTHEFLNSAEYQSLTSGGQNGGPTVTNTYNAGDIYSNYIGGSIGLKSFVDGLYIDVLHTAPDPQGEAHYTNLLATGQAVPSAVVNDFLHIAAMNGGNGQPDPTPPSRNIYTGFLYENVLLRDPDVAGATYWVNQIEQGGVQPGIVTYSFFKSAEFAASGTTVTTG
jgi:hypothetical protein